MELAAKIKSAAFEPKKGSWNATTATIPASDEKT
jgi:hypothetical protein